MKPEFFQDEKLAPLPVLDRFVFLGLICLADDGGRVLDNLKVIDAFLFPESADTAANSLSKLAALGVIRRGIAANGQRVIEIGKFLKHQKIDHPAKNGLLPPIETLATDARDPREDRSNDSRQPRDILAPDQDQDQDQDQYRDQEGEREGGQASAAPRRKRAADLVPVEQTQHFLDAWELYHRERRGSQAAVWRQWRARLGEAVKDGRSIAAEEAAMLAGTTGYMAQVARRLATEPDFEIRHIKLAQTFFGRDRHFEADYGPAEPEAVEPYLSPEDMVSGRVNPAYARAIGSAAR